MLLSLLYDDVLAQDETLVCSTKMARWFRDAESFKLLEQLFESGGTRILGRPLERYPQELQQRALDEPIMARAEQLERFSVNNDGSPITFKKDQRAFHDRLQHLLRRLPSAHRHAGSRRKLDKELGKDLMQAFGDLLETVLIDKRYERWRTSRFNKITPEMADDFVRYIKDPRQAIKRLTQKRPTQPPKFTPEPHELVFSTALAVQVAATYEDRAEDMQNLIETVFATPFCQDEGADGRYGPLLRDLPFPLDDDKEQIEADDAVKVEVWVSTSLRLPRPDSNFAETIQKVRGSPSVRNLRSAMTNLGDDWTFASATNAWKAVADDIAFTVSSGSAKEIDLGMVLASAGKKVLYGTMVDFMLEPPRSAREIPFRLGKQAGEALSSVGGELWSKLRQADLEHQRITRELEEAVDFTCVKHPTIRSGPIVKEK